MLNEKEIRKSIRKHLFECMCNGTLDEIFLDEERITNDEAREKVAAKENFIGSHIWGEKVGENYVVCSYGEQYPLFIYDATEDTWYENGDQYVFNGEAVEQTEEHRSMLKPSIDMHTKTLDEMKEKLDSIKKNSGVEELTHKSVEPGEKN